jgi:hypothetical protein
MIFAGVCVEFIFSPGNVVVEADGHVIGLRKRNMTAPARDMGCSQFKGRRFHFYRSS